MVSQEVRANNKMAYPLYIKDKNQNMFLLYFHRVPLHVLRRYSLNESQVGVLTPTKTFGAFH